MIHNPFKLKLVFSFFLSKRHIRNGSNYQVVLPLNNCCRNILISYLHSFSPSLPPPRLSLICWAPQGASGSSFPQSLLYASIISWKSFSYHIPSPNTLLVTAAAAAAKSLQSCLTLRPHRRQPTRLPCPQDSPGKNTGVGCHFLLQCMKVKSEREVTQSCPTLSGPMDCSLPGSSSHGIFQARVLEWGAIAFSDLSLSIVY